MHKFVINQVKTIPFIASLAGLAWVLVLLVSWLSTPWVEPPQYKLITALQVIHYTSKACGTGPTIIIPASLSARSPCPPLHLLLPSCPWLVQHVKFTLFLENNRCFTSTFRHNFFRVPGKLITQLFTRKKADWSFTGIDKRCCNEYNKSDCLPCCVLMRRPTGLKM